MRGSKSAIAKRMNPATMRERCLNHFDVLGIPVAPEALDATLLRAEKEALPPLRFLDLLLGEQAAQRRERSIARRISEAHFEEKKTWKLSTGTSTRKRSIGSRSSNWPQASSSNARPI